MERAVLEATITNYYESLFRVALNVVKGTPLSPSDILHEAITDLYEKCEDIKVLYEPAKAIHIISPWLRQAMIYLKLQKLEIRHYGIFLHESLDPQWGSGEEYEDRNSPGDLASAVNPAFLLNLQLDVAYAVKTMTPENQRIVQLIMEGYYYKEIADQLGYRTEVTIFKRWKFKLRPALQRALSDYHYGRDSSFQKPFVRRSA